jgi:hypothetical protein
MKKRFVVLALLLGALFVSVRTEARGSTEDVPKMIQTASGVLLDRSASEDQIRDALVRLLDAAVLTLPQSAPAADARSNLESARTEFKDHSVVSEKGRQHLILAYRALNAGKDFQFPEIHSIDEARDHAQKLVAASIASLKKGQGALACSLLLECVIMVVTPIPR